MKRNFKKFVSVALSIMLCATAVPASFVAANAAGGTVTPKVATGGDHTVVLKSDGTVWATGLNDFYGQLGVGDVELPTISGTPYTSTFIQCVDADGVKISDAKDVACGGGHTAIIRKDTGEVWSCGLNNYGQFGNIEVGSGSNSNYSPEFVRSYKSKTGDYIDKDSIVIDGDSANVEQLTGATQIACGSNYTAIICGDKNEVWQCGWNSNGQLGSTTLGSGSGKYSTVFVRSYKSTTGDYIASPDSSNTEAISGAKQIACGEMHTAVICGENSEVWSCGLNNYGQLGNDSTTDSKVFVKSSKYTNGSGGTTEAITGVTQVACGQYYTAIIRGDSGEVWQCGRNDIGQLGNVSTTKSKAFVKSYRSISGEYIATDSIVTEGDGVNAKPITGATEIACGFVHTAVIINGEVWQCGNNEDGQLGNGSTDQSSVFVKSSNITNAKDLSTGYCASHTMAICTEEDGTYALYGVGLNDKGQLGLGNVETPKTTFAKSTTIGDIGSAITADIDTIEALNVPKERNVTGAGQFVNAYKMEVEWGSLSYKYEAKWDTEKSAWGEGTWKLTDEDDVDAGKIIVRNFSSVPCKSVFSFEPNSNFKAPSDDQPGTKGVFEDLKVEKEPLLSTVDEPLESTGGTEGTQKTTPVTSAILAVYTTTNTVGHQKTVKLKLEGIPESKKGTNISAGTNVGETTVTFKKVS